MQSFTSVPFNTETGMSSVNGVAQFSPAGIVLEFESRFLWLTSTGFQEARLSAGGLGGWCGVVRRSDRCVAEERHQGVTQPEVFELWLQKSPRRPARVLPRLARRKAVAA